jgi:UDP-glucose 4-epimerase
MNYIVTGAAGFIGSHLVDELLRQGHKVLAIDNNRENTKRNLPKRDNLEIAAVDVRNIQAIKLTGEYDGLIHLAALADIVPSIEKPDEYFSNNVSGTLSVLELARIAKIKKFIYAASSSCYGLAKQWPATEDTPIKTEYPYAESKYLGERLVMHYARVYKMANTSLRFFNIFGPRSRAGGYGAVFTTFLAQKAQGKPYTVVGDGSQSRDFLYVTDAVEAILASLKSEFTGIFNIGGGSHYSINHLVELLGYPRQIVHLPKRPGEPDMTMASITKAQDLLKWTPMVDFNAGVRIMLENLDSYKDLKAWTEKEIAEATVKWFHYLKDDTPKPQQLFPS